MVNVDIKYKACNRLYNHPVEEYTAFLERGMHIARGAGTYIIPNDPLVSDSINRVQCDNINPQPPTLVNDKSIVNHLTLLPRTPFTPKTCIHITENANHILTSLKVRNMLLFYI